MQNWKQFFKRMNLDADVRSMQPGDYRKLTNGTPIQPASSSYANSAQDIVCNLIGNQLVTNTLPGGTNQIIGFVEDRKSNRIFFAAWNNTASNNSIYQYSGNTGAIVLVMRTALFPWAQTDFVDMDIVGDILIFTNNRSDVQKINVTKAIAGGTYTPLAVQLTLIKPPPLAPLNISLSYGLATDTNYLYGNYFQFFYRYIYEDYDYSVFSPSSAVTDSWTHPGIAASDILASSNINVAALVGPGTFDGRALFAGNRILLLGQTTATQNGVWIVQAGAWTRPADFATGSNSNILVYIEQGDYNIGQVWNVKSTNVDTIAPTLIRLEGPNYITVSRLVAIPATVIGIEYAVRINGSNEFIVYQQEKVGGFSSSHDFYNDTYLFTVPDSDTLLWNDNVPLMTKSLKIFKNRIFLFNNTEGYNHTTTTSVGLSLTNVTFAYTKAFRVAKNGGRYRVGVVWFDFAGRHSGVHCDAIIKIPNRTTFSITGYSKIHVDLSTIAADVPSWAIRISVVMTKELTRSFFISCVTNDTFYYKKDTAGAYTYTKTLAGFAAEGSVIDISNLTRDRKGYTFQPGDRIVLNTPLTGFIDLEILGQDGRFLLTRVINELASYLDTAGSERIEFEIYTPKIIDQEQFYETGVIATGDIEGDVEVINTYFADATGGYSQTAPFTNNYSVIGHWPMENMTIWNKNFPQWVTQSGRSMIKTDSRQINKYTYLRWGQLFILNANFLGINTFYALDEQALPIENGSGIRLAEAGEILVAVHEIETEAVYVGQGFVKIDAGVNQFLTKTEGVVGDVRRYLGGNGSVHQASVVSRNGNVYFFDLRKGMIIRRAQDGLTRISENGAEGLISTLANTHAALATSKIIAGWDPQYKSYCISFIDTSGPSGKTLYFNEKSNSWIFQSDLIPEFFGILGQKQFAFLSGACWVQTMEGNYNKFFGVQYNRTLEMEFSPLRSLIHIWDAIEIDVENIYVTGGSNEDIVLLYHKNGDTLQTKINYADFKTRESDRVWKSAFFRWINDPNFTGGNAITLSKYGSAKRIRGQSAFMTIVYNGTDRNPMKSVTIFYTPSMQSAP